MKYSANKKTHVSIAYYILAILLFVSCPNLSSSDTSIFIPKVYYSHNELENMSSITFAKILQVGWNLGNTFDSVYRTKNEHVIGEEAINALLTSRSNPLTTKELIQEVKKAGFSTIRIPVSWHEHVSTDGKNIIDKEWIEKVQQVIDWSLEANLYTIINIHHDDKFEEGPGYYLSEEEYYQEKSIKYISDIWSQVADYFKNYDNHLIFEILNEPRYMKCASNNSFRPTSMEEIKFNKIIPIYEEAGIKAIREQGGYNNVRFILVPTYAASPWNIQGWKIPTDNYATDKLLISLHTYSPYDFAMGTRQTTTFTKSHESSIKNLVNSIIKKEFLSKGYGVVIGETSASDKNNQAERIKWINCYFTACRDAGIPLIIWDNNSIYKPDKGDIKEFHGYLNRGSLAPEVKNVSSHWYDEVIIQTMMDAYSYFK